VGFTRPAQKVFPEIGKSFKSRAYYAPLDIEGTVQSFVELLRMSVNDEEASSRGFARRSASLRFRSLRVQSALDVPDVAAKDPTLVLALADRP